MAKILTFVTGPLGTNTYIVYSDDKKSCFIIDPCNAKKMSDVLKENGLKPSHILLTHGHFDHILAVAQLQKEYGAKVCIHADDANALANDIDNLSAYLSFKVEKCKADILLKDGDIISIGDMEIKVMHTPGHSPGSVCFIFESERVIFSGDTLFHLSVGRTDFEHSSKKDLKASILYKLYMLKGDYTVLPGHEEQTTLDYERQNNPFTNGTFDYE